MCRQRGWGMFPGTLLANRTDSQVARIVAVNVRSGAEGDKQTPNVTKDSYLYTAPYSWCCVRCVCVCVRIRCGEGVDLPVYYLSVCLSVCLST